MVMMAGTMSRKTVVYEIENRGKRSFIIGLHEHVSGGKVNIGTDNKPRNVHIEPGTSVKVTEACGKRLSEGYKDEIKLVRKISRKE